MQSLHRGSFCAQDGEKPGEGRDVNPLRAATPVEMLSGVLGTSRLTCTSSITRHFRVHIRRFIGSAQKALASTYRRIFG